jgi:hypothetical protein
MGVFAPALPFRLLSRKKRAKIQLNPFVHESLISLHERLAFQIVKEQPMFQKSEFRWQKSEHRRLMRRQRKRWRFCLLIPEFCLLRGGADRDRTDDPLLAKQVLSQLSYSPACTGGSGWIRTIDPRLIKTVL